MSIAEIEKTKLELIDWIKDMSNEDMLNTLESLKATDETDKDWKALPEAHRDAIMLGVQQVKNGEVLSSEEFWKQLKGH